MRVVITGAAGRIGIEIARELSTAHELCFIDKRPIAGFHSILADLAKIKSTSRYTRWVGLKRSSWVEYMNGADVVLHLAADPSPEAPWPKVLRDNIEATWNVVEAAARLGVPRVVFASSNYAVKALENELAPTCYMPWGPKIDSNASPHPLTSYGVTKAVGEVIGQSFVNDKKLTSFVAVRIGVFSPTPPLVSPWRHLWIGPRDVRSLLRSCIERQFSGFHVVYGVSAQSTIPYDLSHTRRLLSWSPQERNGSMTMPSEPSATHN
jgi:nucleoside-diphosphate-sugar epimerase